MRLAAALEFSARTDPGRVRSQNEDSLAFDAENGFALLADGMGGYNAGEVASSLAVAMIAGGLKARLATVAGSGRREDISAVNGIGILLHHLIGQANSEIYRRSMMQSKLRGMGTTLVAAVFCDNKVVIAHIGDSRLYRLRGPLLQRLTRDHTVLQERIDRGELTAEEAANLPPKGLLTRALGAEAVVPVEVHSGDVLPGDVFLLCSDGLSDMVSEIAIGQTLASKGDLTEITRQLVKIANDNGGMDNISVLAVRVNQAFPAAQ